MGLLSWLFGKSNKKTNGIEPLHEGSTANQKPNSTDLLHEVAHTNRCEENSNNTSCFTFFADNPHIADYTHVGMSMKLWIPKGVDNPDKVYIYHRDGPGGCLGIVPSLYTKIIASHLLDALDYDAVIEELADNKCKMKCRLIPMEETIHRMNDKKESLRKELTKAYTPKKPITINLRTKKKYKVNVGDKLRMELNDLDSYLQDVSSQRGPYSNQWTIKFLDQNGIMIGILDHDKSTMLRVLKAHFNSYLFDIKVSDTFSHTDFPDGDPRSYLKGYFIKLVITPYKSST